MIAHAGPGHRRRGSLQGERLAMLLAAVVPLAPADYSRELQTLRDQVSTLGLELKTVGGEVAETSQAVPPRRFEERFADAEMLFLLGDHERAALSLYEVVRDPEVRSQPLYPRALYYLSESLFQLGNLDSAARGFTELVQRRDPDHARDAVRRLFQIGDRRGRWDGLEDLVATLRASGTLPADIAYTRAKSFLARGKPRDALQACEEIPPTHRLSAKGRYLAAVAAVEMSDFEDALRRFAELTQLAGDFEDLAVVRELSAMNLGRIHLEQGRIADAASDYQLVPRQSERFEESLYEVTWSYVRSADTAANEAERRSEFGKARNALEILLLSDDDKPLQPEARLLLGNILLRLGIYDGANAAFAEVVRRYGPVRDELARLESEAKNPDEYFEVVASRQKQGAGFLPPIALRWATISDELTRALGLMASLDVSDGWLRDAQTLADRLTAASGGEGASTGAPGLREALTRRRRLEAGLTDASQRLLGVERSLLQPSLSPDDARALEALLTERAALEPDYRALVAGGHQYDADLETARARIAITQREAYQLRYPIRSMQESVDAVRTWLVDHAGTLPAAEDQGVRERMHLQELEIQELGRLQRELEDDLVREKDGALAGDPAAKHDQEVLTAYNLSLERERELLARARPSAPEEAKPTLEETEAVRRTLAGYLAELGALSARLEDAAARDARSARVQLAEQVRAIVELREAAAARRREAQHVIGEVAAYALGEVRAKVQDVVLRADVGLVDVAWTMKEEQSELINDKVSEERRELQALDTEFQDVLIHD